MAKAKTLGKVNGTARPESELSQVLGRVPEICAELGRPWTVFLVVVALVTRCRWVIGGAAALNAIASAAKGLWGG